MVLRRAEVVGLPLELESILTPKENQVPPDGQEQNLADKETLEDIKPSELTKINNIQATNVTIVVGFRNEIHAPVLQDTHVSILLFNISAWELSSIR